jgi:intracellular septation protein
MRVIIRFLMSLAVEFGPVVVFFFAAEQRGFFFGTSALIAATILALGTALARERRVPWFSLLSSSFVLAFGLATLNLRNPYWIQLEYTLYNAFFALALFTGLVFNRALLKPLFGTTFLMSDRGWHILSFRWALFFAATALGNEYFLRFTSNETWVRFRFYAAIILCIFGFSQFFLSRRERLPHASPWGLKK